MTSCENKTQFNPSPTPKDSIVFTPNTKEMVLYHLKSVVQKQKILVGHQSSSANGVGWRLWQYPDGNKSDFFEVSQHYPAVYGWEIADKQNDNSTTADGFSFDNTIQQAIKAYNRGALNTFSMHPYRLDMNNSSSWNATPGYVATLIPNGGLHEAYKTWLNRIVIALLTLKNTRQEPIPFIFRPYHEMDGSWFWWGSTACTDEEYKQLFRFTIEYMRAQGLNNMLVCYAPSMYQNKMQYLKRYPGDDVVDILGVDAYYKSANPNSNNGDANWTNIINKLKIVSDLAIEKNKVAALTETGQQNITSADYFSRLNTQINQAGVQISYLMFWCNYAATVDAGGGAGFYVPYNSWNQTASKQNFVQFCNQPNVLTATTMPNIYQ